MLVPGQVVISWGTISGRLTLRVRHSTAPDRSSGCCSSTAITASDITHYESQAGLPNVPLTNVLIDGASGSPTGSGGEVEVSLDIEMAISMAPGLSKVIVYEAPDRKSVGGPLEPDGQRQSGQAIELLVVCARRPGAEPAADAIFQQMAAQGQSFFNASGDYDAFTGLIAFPATRPTSRKSAERR